jgi:hypothetical protein
MRAIRTEVHGVEGLGAVEGDDGDAVGEDAALHELLRGGDGHGGEAADKAERGEGFGRGGWGEEGSGGDWDAREQSSHSDATWLRARWRSAVPRNMIVFDEWVVSHQQLLKCRRGLVVMEMI